MIGLASAVERLGQVVTRRELIDHGFTGRQLTFAVATGLLIRPRRGWYAAPDADPALIRAVRVGGRLGCVSAAERHGWAVARRGELHVSLPENASRLRHPDDRTTYPSAEEFRDLQGLVLHWHSPLSRHDRPKLLTSPYETTLQIAACQHPDIAVAAFDSFINVDPRRAAHLEDWLRELPRRFFDALPRRESGCHSFLETIGRIRLERVGIRGVHQVPIAGVGRVDLVLGGRVVIEWDGREFHDTPDAHDPRVPRPPLHLPDGHGRLVRRRRRRTLGSRRVVNSSGRSTRRCSRSTTQERHRVSRPPSARTGGAR
jgi:hypothetical protein